ncbi:MAG: 3-hydroxylacyl-ACP dehydratase [Gammaproteobacteria bacterium]|uniref:3-hydroxylacyl-ACP dehydratase n=1 Tax=Rhodoferax sp. TaxID=50421 RepID=UPI0017A4E41B|nr:3-hydroxylacyl-ACP dehydratase [Rhodoferax sp.]MBU3898337.1 3-hydroxylacyl-ACP dehydratase [Gammaproteobacteria bacterium]MBA3058965.1 3-hydroxylacyl-ACP dehydratase [Rhodoferax sp.]MBU3996170.1 3-hydroxylacyl-ACP dehydratase [Gammaproteobacteria bacterium]MBU4081522.1 3-hydroxylacyl-ACP dehydratase [Gammaproteobacteria bacterium]MBU4112636.1 3-hydroxylacyl-ACP dehydratase [Gammaproteobacteria bacterium]
MRVPATLQHADIARRIPHQGSMCLLECVSAWDTQQICCEASSHRDSNNPLRAHGRLGAACGIEYAAQAMAVHGALLAEADSVVASQRPTLGYLVSVRGVTLHVDRLDDLSDALSIHAERSGGDSSTVLYSFTLHAGSRLLLGGRAAVILDAHGLALPQRSATTPPKS